MNNKFAERLKEYLDSECSDYELEYSWDWDEDFQYCEVKIFDNCDNQKTLYFKYDENKDDLEIELSEGSFYKTREFDSSVKYFWMLISPIFFNNN